MIPAFLILHDRGKVSSEAVEDASILDPVGFAPQKRHTGRFARSLGTPAPPA